MQDIEVSFDLSRIDFRATSDQLMQSYWGASRTDEANRRAFDNSLCVGAYLDGEQVGFARVITDYAVFAYLLDVIVWPDRRGHGIGKRLVQALLDHPGMKTVSHWSLTTNDAHSLYQKFGFGAEGRYMRLDRSPTG
ncbi:GNAT family N-acetyltransferase [Mesorhizobium atlanticum]|uniref:GNAT family N-acetyltransferase n=1 Tax=Mesorhizobium sp. WSM4976 TaxID=3038549 RepID=UPI002416186C|nr:GNAT family N-acetyltransferase [Mesorhizobium sp. WSM4976]MDG4896603.1 GNAT family N-acetyltransferase [Mesorhizobium sp. WSM4976]